MKKGFIFFGVGIFIISFFTFTQKTRAQGINRLGLVPGNNTAARVPVKAMLPKTVIETISSSGRTQLTELLTKAGLISYLSGTENYTLFAPSPEAITTLEQMPPEKLRGTLLYHLVPGRFALRDLKEGTKLRTVTGEELTILRLKDQILVNGIAIDLPNEGAANGIIHTLSGSLAANY